MEGRGRRRRREGGWEGGGWEGGRGGREERKRSKKLCLISAVPFTNVQHRTHVISTYLSSLRCSHSKGEEG